jgi:hypothetical protein
MAAEESTGTDDQPGSMQVDQLCKDSIKVTLAGRIQNVHLQPEVVGLRQHFPLLGFGKGGIAGIDEQTYDSRRGDQLVEQLKSLCSYYLNGQ